MTPREAGDAAVASLDAARARRARRRRFDDLTLRAHAHVRQAETLLEMGLPGLAVTALALASAHLTELSTLVGEDR